MTKLTFPDDSFDLVVEKATLDSLLVEAKSPWDLTSPGHKLVSQSLREVKRVLKPCGLFLSITFSQPHHRVPLLTQPELECGHRKTSRCLRLFCSYDERRRRRWRQGGPE